MITARTFLANMVLGAALLIITSDVVLAGPNCTCRYSGQNYKTGDIMCIRGKLSKCDFVLNNTSWKTIAETCPQVMAPGLSPTSVGDIRLTVFARMKNRFIIN